MQQHNHGPRIRLGAALARDWPWLTGAALFPFYLVLSERLLAVPVGYRSVLFPVFLLPAMWPVLKKDAPYTFWVCALGVLVASLILATIINAYLGA